MKIEKAVREIIRKHGNYCFEMGRKDELSSDEAVTAILGLIEAEVEKQIDNYHEQFRKVDDRDRFEE